MLKVQKPEKFKYREISGILHIGGGGSLLYYFQRVFSFILYKRENLIHLFSEHFIFRI